uniref:Uncharacterized protein n=1 Tax=Labrus bergylta TaxID=56723 RepID=A0A3Q3GFP6_9LABR
MPICSVMWSQVPGVPSAWSLAFTIVFTLSFLESSGVLRVMATIRAPWDGGLDHVVLTIFSIWDRTLFRLSALRATMVRLPTRSSDGTEICQSLARQNLKSPMETKLPEANP